MDISKVGANLDAYEKMLLQMDDAEDTSSNNVASDPEAIKRKLKEEERQMGLHMEELSKQVNRIAPPVPEEQVNVPQAPKVPRKPAPPPQRGSQMEEQVRPVSDQIPRPVNVGPEGSRPSSQASGPKRSPMVGLYSEYSDIETLMSVSLIANQIKFLAQNIAKKVFVDDFFNQRLNALQEHISKFNNSFQNGRIDRVKYVQSMIDTSYKAQQFYLTKAEQNKAKPMFFRVQDRIRVLTEEQTLLNQEGDLAFDQIKMDAKKLSIPNYNPFVIGKPEDIGKFQEDTIDQSSIKQRLKKISIRKTQYQNLAMYFASKLNGLKAKIVTEYYRPLIVMANQQIQKLQKGEDLQIGAFMVNQFQELGIKDFHGLKNEDERRNVLREMYQDLENGRDSEKKFKKAGAHIQMNTQIKSISQGREQEYLSDMNYVKELINQPWVFLPKLQRREEKKEIAIVNKDIEKDEMQFSLKRFTGLKSDQYKIKYSIEVNGSICSFECQCQDDLIINHNNQFKYVSQQRKVDALADLHTKTINLIIFDQGFFGGWNEYAQGTIKLDPLEMTNTISSAVEISHKNKTFKLEYEVKTKSPTSQMSEFNVVSVQIVEKYDELNINEGVEEYVAQVLQNSNIVQVPKIPSAAPKEERKEEKNVSVEAPQEPSNPSQPPVQEKPPEIVSHSLPNAGAAMQIEPTLSILDHSKANPWIDQIKAIPETQYPKIFNQEAILKIQNPAAYACIAYLEKLSELIPPAIEQFSVEVNRQAQQYAEELQRFAQLQQSNIEYQSEQGQLTPEKYLEGVRFCIQKDQVLKEFVLQRNIIPWANFIAARLKLMEDQVKGIQDSLREQEEEEG